MDDRYILSQIDQQIVSMSLRLNYNITPDLTIQYWGQPFLAAMDYSRFKVVTDPQGRRAGRPLPYSDRQRDDV
ncbi:MAG: hypothetical protein MZV63_50220 [Marinilabiliales bacterium]|nr:hypothetical protein [Marinilabiliales bacterium]